MCIWPKYIIYHCDTGEGSADRQDQVGGRRRGGVQGRRRQRQECADGVGTRLAQLPRPGKRTHPSTRYIIDTGTTVLSLLSPF